MTAAINKEKDQFLYQQVIDLIENMQESGTLNPGDKLPSLRKLSNQINVSIPTVKQAYIELERLSKIEARPKSGYYLRVSSSQITMPKKPNFVKRPVVVRTQTLIEQVYQAVHAPNSLALGIANPVMASPPDKTLARIMRRVLAQAGAKIMSYGPMDGYLPLKRQLAQRYLEQGITASTSDIIITNGAQEALSIAIQSVAKTGDIIAVESPTYFGVLELIENLGMMALEIPCCSENGICLDELEESLDEHDVKACIFSSSINNPTGSCMPEEKRAKLVALTESKKVPLIEDAVYDDLHFGEQKALPLQAYSTKGLVLTCNSFSKTAAPSFRVGWLFTERYEQKAKGLKRAMSCSSSLLNQWVLHEYLRSGDFDRHIKRLLQVLRTNKERMLILINKHFPDKTRVSNPLGGCVLWVELPPSFDSIKLFKQSVENGISITPGVLFSASGKYKRCFRISFGLPWSDTVEKAIAKLGELAHKQT